MSFCHLAELYFSRFGLALLAAVLLCLSRPCAAVLEVEPQTKQYTPGSHFQFYIDEKKSLDIHRLLAQQNSLNWQPAPGEFPSFGFNDFAVWGHMQVRLDAKRGSFWYLINHYPLLDRMDTYLVKDGEILDQITAGDVQAFKERTVKHPALAFPIFLEPGVVYDIYVRAESTGALQFILTWNEPNSFWQRDHVSSALMGGFYGVYLIMIAYNFILFFFVRDISYLYYVCFITSFALIQATLTGWAFQFLWPNTPSLQQWVIPIFVSSVVFFGVLFSLQYMKLRSVSLFWYRLYVAAALLAVVIALFGIFAPYWLAIRITVLFVTITAFMAALASFYILARFRTRQAFFYCVAWSLMLVGGAIYAANKYGLIPITQFSEHIIQAGGILEVLLLSAALGDRINQERKERFATQKELLRVQIEMNEALEQKVKARTQELEKVNLLLEEASITDPLTGVQNRRYFDRIYASEFRRALREQKPLSMLLFDIDHFKKINDNFGHPFGDEVIKAIAAAISRNIRRPPDSLARMGGEEFVLLLPHTPLAGATNLAERIREQVEHLGLHFGEQAVAVTISCGVATIQPKADDTPEAFYQRVDEKLYQAKREGRNRVQS